MPHNQNASTSVRTVTVITTLKKQQATEASAIMEGEDLDYFIINNFTKLPLLQQQLKMKSDDRPMPKLELCTARKKGANRT